MLHRPIDKTFINQILQNYNTFFLLITCSFLAFNLTGCATISFTPIATTPQKSSPGIYHRVEKGQTLWKISKLYNLELEELMEINRINDTSNIEINQMLFIPQKHQQNAATSNIAATEDFLWPLKGKIIAKFGQLTNNMINKGINIQAYSDSDVVATRSGIVTFCSENFINFGKTIIIDHGDGFSSVYTGNSKVIVKTGDSVNKGTAIAKIKKSGRAENSYLHFEIRKGYTPQNPNFYLPLKATRN